MDQFSAPEKCYQNLFSRSFFNTRVFDCDMWGHSESLVRVIEFKLFVVFVFLVFGIANVSNYSKFRPKFVLSFSPLWSLFFVSKSYQKWSQNGVWRVQKSQKSDQSMVSEVLKSFWSFWSRRLVGLGRPGGLPTLSRRVRGPE